MVVSLICERTLIALNFHRPAFDFRGNDFVQPRDSQFDSLGLYNVFTREERNLAEPCSDMR